MIYGFNYKIMWFMIDYNLKRLKCVRLGLHTCGVGEKFVPNPLYQTCY